MKQKIWIVMGSTGEYSDRQEWPVVAFTSERSARDRIVALDELMQQIPQEWYDYQRYVVKIKDIMAPLDPTFQTSYSGTSYFYYVVDLET